MLTLSTRITGRRSDQGARLSPRKQPSQERARETVAAILTAAAEVFATRGYAGTTTNRIARRAGVSIGSLYQYFPNKDALLAGLMERHLAQVHSVVERSTAELEDPAIPLADSIRSLMLRLIDLHEADPQLTRALSSTAFHLHHKAHVHGQGEQAYAVWMERILRARPEVRRGNTAVMAHLLVEATEALTRWLVHEAPGSLDRTALVDEMVLLLTGYVQPEAYTGS